MTDTHPITPPPELVQQWKDNWVHGAPQDVGIQAWLAIQAARWGSDQELEACCAWLQDPDLNVDTYKLRAARRSKPPSLKEQALDAWDRLRNEAWCEEIDHDLNLIRTALERLQELEQND